MSLLKSKEYVLYANFLNRLAKDLTKFYYEKLNKTFKVSNKKKTQGMILLQHQIRLLKDL